MNADSPATQFSIDAGVAALLHNHSGENEEWVWVAKTSPLATFRNNGLFWLCNRLHLIGFLAIAIAIAEYVFSPISSALGVPSWSVWGICVIATMPLIINTISFPIVLFMYWPRAYGASRESLIFSRGLVKLRTERLAWRDVQGVEQRTSLFGEAIGFRLSSGKFSTLSVTHLPSLEGLSALFVSLRQQANLAD